MKLFNKNFIIVSLSGVLMFISFYLLMPVIAMYCVDVFNADPATTGIVVASYIITALILRPFSGFLVDSYDHKRFYLIALGIFAFLFIGYIVSDSIASLILTRVLLGACFAMVTTAGNTLIIDVLPSERRSEGIGYYGAFIVLAMAIGPMIGLYLLETFSYMGLFIVAVLSSFIAFLLVFFVKTKPRPKVVNKEVISFDRFFLIPAFNLALVMALISFLNGSLMVYMALYVKNSSVAISSGNFFLVFAAGVITSRVLAGKAMNKGKQTTILQIALLIVILGALLFIFFLNSYTFIISSFLMGLGFGVAGPAIQTLMIDMVAHNRRGTANSTYFIALDFGSGMGMLLGGSIASIFNYRAIFIVGLGLVILGMLFFNIYVRKRLVQPLQS